MQAKVRTKVDIAPDFAIHCDVNEGEVQKQTMTPTPTVIGDTIEKEADSLVELSKKIWSNPELALKEVFAHDVLSEFLEKSGFTVERNFVLETAFRATYTQGEGGANVIAICEYDALPDIGHACGHNLISESGERYQDHHDIGD